MEQLRGVNLGGWLVLEKWMNQNLFAGTDAMDETYLCLQLGRDRAVIIFAGNESSPRS